MNNYKLHITPVDANQWVGHAISNEEVVFTTNVCSTPQECSQILSKFAASQGTSPAPVQPSTLERDSAVIAPPAPEAPRKCCGRS